MEGRLWFYGAVTGEIKMVLLYYLGSNMPLVSSGSLLGESCTMWMAQQAGPQGIVGSRVVSLKGWECLKLEAHCSLVTFSLHRRALGIPSILPWKDSLLPPRNSGLCRDHLFMLYVFFSNLKCTFWMKNEPVYLTAIAWTFLYVTLFEKFVWRCILILLFLILKRRRWDICFPCILKKGKVYVELLLFLYFSFNNSWFYAYIKSDRMCNFHLIIQSIPSIQGKNNGNKWLLFLKKGISMLYAVHQTFLHQTLVAAHLAWAPCAWDWAFLVIYQVSGLFLGMEMNTALGALEFQVEGVPWAEGLRPA